MKKQDLKTLLESSTGKKILFLGKEGVYTVQESNRFLKRHKLTRVKGIEEGIVASVEHHRLNPVEEMISEDAYVRKIPAYKLEEFERLISENINDDEILMAIKLTNDQARVLRMIENPDISDTLFVKLLKMYEWHKEEEDNNDDRSVVIATLTRYIDVTPAERDQLYSTLTLKRLVREATDPKLLHALISFPNYEFKQKNKGKISLYELIATSHSLDQEVTKRLLSLHDTRVDMYLAANPAIDLEQLKKFALREEQALYEALASNENIDDSLFELLLGKGDDVVRLLLWYQLIGPKRYEIILQKLNGSSMFSEIGKNPHIEYDVMQSLIERDDINLLENIAANKSVTTDLLETLYKKQLDATFLALAANPNLPIVILKTLYKKFKDDTMMMHQIASNPNTPEPILRELYERDVVEINKGLASNSSTPIEILDILKIDTRMRNALTKNEVFIKYHNTTKVII